MIEQLCEKIKSSSNFSRDFNDLYTESIKTSLGFKTVSTSVSVEQISKLLECATHFALSQSLENRNLAFKIAISAYDVNLKFKIELNILDVVRLIFSRLGNYPTINFFLSEKKQTNALASGLWFKYESHKIHNTINFLPNREMVLTDFQRALWASLEDQSNILTVTAPTSAGKSFTLKHYLIKNFAEHKDSWFLYLVPSRALINQVYDDFAPLVGESIGNEFSITTAPISPSVIKTKGGLYILTQERLQTLLEENPELKFSYVVIDEAQIIGSDSRGVILQNMIELLIRRSKHTKFLFGCPFISNPDVFNKLFPTVSEKGNVISETESPVIQNIISVLFSANNEKVNLSLIGKTEEQLGEIQLQVPSVVNLKSESGKLSYISYLLTIEGSTIIYAGGQASCEEIADEISTLNSSNVEDDELNEFSDFLKEHIHKDYSLALTIKSGVGFHYGKMPSIVRKTVEDLFQSGKLKFLVCTSTLLHGVNLPAKNLFMLKPTKGRDWVTKQDKQLSGADFWNLAGRVGRLGKEFSGNVFLIDYNRWSSKPLSESKYTEIVPSVTQGLTGSRQNLLDFINNINHGSGNDDLSESTFMKMYNEEKRGNLDALIENTIGPASTQSKEIVDKIRAIIVGITVPDEICAKNSLVSVLRQQELLNYLVKKCSRREDAEDVIPPHPLSQDAYKKMFRLLKRIHSYLEKKPGADKSHLFFAKIANNWMAGYPLARLIEERIKYKKDSQVKEPNISATIREVMDSVENDLRFRYVKFVKCHNDILAHALQVTGNDDLIERIPAIPLYLEFGASTETMINIISLGISRTTAGILQKQNLASDLNRDQVLKWIEQKSWEKTNISRICKKELRRHLGEHT